MSEFMKYNPEEYSPERDEQARIIRTNEQFDYPPLVPMLDIAPNQENAKAGVDPVVMAPGWSEEKQVLGDEVMAMVESGYRTLVAEHDRKGYLNQVPEELQLEAKDVNLTSAAFQRSLNILNNLEQKQLDRVSVVAHSQGCTDALVAALLDPEKFKGGIVLVNPGIAGEDNLLSLAARFSRQLPKNSLQQQRDGGLQIAQNAKRAMSEVVSVSQSDLLELAYTVRQSGVPLTMILGEKDAVFPADRVLQRVHDKHYAMQLASGEEMPLPFDLITAVEGWHHNSNHQQPEQAAELYDQHLRYMRNQGAELG